MEAKPRYMLLQFKNSSFIIVERQWYDFLAVNEPKIEEDYSIVKESDDYSLLHTMGKLTERLI